jgi:hypothetical protein
VWPNDTKEEYSARFLEVPGFDTWQIVTVPDGTRHGDLDNRDGTFTRPPIHTPPAESKILSKINFQDYAVSQLGGSVTGMARFQTIIDSCEKSTGAVKFCYSRYVAASKFEKNDVKDFTDILVLATIVTLAEQEALLVNWPNE